MAGEYPQVVFWADSRRRIRQFRKLMIKANQFEVLGRENPPPGQSVPMDALAEAMDRLRRQTAAPVFVTRSDDGMVVSDPEPTLVPAVRVNTPTDPTGAGDSATAGAVLALTAGAEVPEAALIGNLVASITVQQLATTGSARPEDLAPRLAMWRRQQAGNA
jgi:sugar/nucleoside kinase (ribokinase family)